MSEDWVDRLSEWSKERQANSGKPEEEGPLPVRPLTQRLDTMANMFTYGFWGWEYENETKELLLEAAKTIQMYEELMAMERDKLDE